MTIDLDEAFSDSRPVGIDVAKHHAIRSGAKEFAEMIDTAVPEGPAKTLAIRKIEEAMMWANKGISVGSFHDS